MISVNIAAVESKYGNKIAAVILSATAANNGRLNGLAMTESQKFTARRAVKLGLMTEHHAMFPGFREVPMFELAA
ncbi:hypothetical protein RD110_11090 [Rhodoferax koreense]|uniref:Uncharacterized protein n=1 Tax=Rhodoferax koreensis TaxID=1842727 RepID=A0A1P8JV96_9BURK|nr:hypothetical protein [Rhodoferax koreense]APW37672.1 hypothetical protein RD110_11090 [Rhodoferax koreense]